MQVPGRGPPAHEAHELLLLVHDGHDGHDRSLIVQQGRPFARSKKAGMEGQLRGWSLQPLVEEGLGGVDLALSGDVGRHDHLTREVHQEELVDARRLADEGSQLPAHQLIVPGVLLVFVAQAQRGVDELGGAVGLGEKEQLLLQRLDPTLDGPLLAGCHRLQPVDGLLAAVEITDQGRADSHPDHRQQGDQNEPHEQSLPNHGSLARL